MSFSLMAEVWKLDLPALEKWVLMALADEDRETGAGVWPSLETLSAKTGLSVRSVTRELGRLVQHSFLVPQGSRTGGRGHSTRYQIDLEAGQVYLNLDRQSRFIESDTRTDSLGLDQKRAETWTEMHVNLDCQSREPIIKPIIEPIKADDGDFQTVNWLASAYQVTANGRKLSAAQLAELALLVGRIPAGERMTWCERALSTMAGQDLASPFGWLRKVFLNALAAGKAPGTNGSGAHTAPAFDDAAALAAYYTPASYAGIVEH